VLKQRVKLTELNLPRYIKTSSNEEVLNQIQLVDEDEHPTFMKVLKNLMEKSPWLGSNVNYTAYALSTAVTCFTYNNLSFVLSLLVNRIGKLAGKNNEGDTIVIKDSEAAGILDNKIDKALGDVRMTLAVFVDKVAAVEGELELFATGLWDYEKTKNKNDEHIKMFKGFEKIKKKVDEKINHNCYLTPPEEIYRYLGKYGSLNNSPPSPDELASDDETLKSELAEFDKIIDCMLHVYDGLDVETMPMKTWLQILDYRLPISMKIKV